MAGKKAKIWTVAQLIVADNKQSVKDFSATIKSVTMTTSAKSGDPIAEVALVDATSPDKPITIEVWKPTADLTNLPAGSILSVDRAYVKEFQNEKRLGVSMFFPAKPGDTWPDGNPKVDQPAGIVKINGTAVTGAKANGVKATGTNALDKAIAAAPPGPSSISVPAAKPSGSGSMWDKKPEPKADDRGKSLDMLYHVFVSHAPVLIPMLADADLDVLKKIEALPAKNHFPLMKALYAIFVSHAPAIIGAGFLVQADIDTLKFVEGIEGI